MTATASVRRGQDESEDASSKSTVPLRLLIVVAIVGVLVVAGTWVVAFSSIFGVRTVSVRGGHTVSAAEVRGAAHLARGAPLVRLDTDAIRSRVETLPDVASAMVTTSFPSTVTITISERVAVGVVQVPSGYLLVDRTGDQFRKVAHRRARLPMFVVPQGPSARATGGAVATVAAALPATLRARIASIQALDPSAITLLLKNGRVVEWGSADRSADKARVLPTLLRQPGAQFDVTDPDQPFAR